MPITVRHTPVGALGQLALETGRGRAREIKIGRDIQLTSMLLSMQERGADVAARRAFAFQQAGAAQIARQRPAEPDTLKQRQNLRQFVSEAKAAGIYEPAQIKQAQIYADLGYEKEVRSILSKLPEPTTRRRELQEQFVAVTEIGKGEISRLREQLDAVNSQLEKRFTPGTQRLLRERPEYMETVSPDIQELLAQQQQLEGQIATVTGRTARMGRMLQLGISIPEQMTFEAKQEARLTKEEETQYERLIEQTREAGKLTEREELAIDIMRDREREQRIAVGREITRLSKDLAPFADEGEGDHTERIKPIQTQIRQLELEQVASFAREKKQIEEFLRKDKKALTQIVTDATGQRWRFTGRYQNGKPIYETIE